LTHLLIRTCLETVKFFILGKSRMARKLVYLLVVAGLIAGVVKGAHHYKDLIAVTSINVNTQTISKKFVILV